MGVSLRPVIETWGPHVDYSADIDDIESVLTDIAELNDITVLCDDYTDLRVWWFGEGEKFLKALEEADPAYYPQCSEDLSRMKAMVNDWREMIDPGDGSMRFYVD